MNWDKRWSEAKSGVFQALERHGERGRRAGAGEISRRVRHLQSMIRITPRSSSDRV
jgi:hypothetical protein